MEETDDEKSEMLARERTALLTQKQFGEADAQGRRNSKGPTWEGLLVLPGEFGLYPGAQEKPA